MSLPSDAPPPGLVDLVRGLPLPAALAHGADGRIAVTNRSFDMLDGEGVSKPGHHRAVWIPFEIEGVEWTLMTAAPPQDVVRVEERFLQQHRRIRHLTRRLLTLQEEERTRLSHEIHDRLGQQLTALKIALSAPGSDVSPSSRPGYGDAIRLLDRMMDDVRTLAFELRPSLLEDVGLPAAVREHTERQAGRGGLDTRVVVDPGTPTLSPDAATACFRILQEALTNVHRHADASRVEVRLLGRGDWTVLTVRDDGRGITDRTLRASDPGHQAGLGIRIMKERARVAGGELYVERGRDGGTIVTARFPVDTVGAGDPPEPGSPS